MPQSFENSAASSLHQIGYAFLTYCWRRYHSHTASSHLQHFSSMLHSERDSSDTIIYPPYRANVITIIYLTTDVILYYHRARGRQSMHQLAAILSTETDVAWQHVLWTVR